MQLSRGWGAVIRKRPHGEDVQAVFQEQGDQSGWRGNEGKWGSALQNPANCVRDPGFSSESQGGRWRNARKLCFRF